ncbi:MULTISPECIES: alpha/beta hydrolase [unclassified Beijerinckia]|uniref:alpha/beta fold hydrolase n=1 Tax=unclassified Beijerinckia TaxID=2638183 RepID=UPI000895AE46|nr:MULTISPECIES: alpha/beta hydrolase [unclassified Beijerinckia]MDH7794646.1 pimeloyl-ACP methyl ester carboxylesterase [Beijerinckia sp. GAS462]SEB69741.1 Lysophospholipase, alpha-beta hydrolase superfamily [Beijerinckia sp. 28-YEA-48]
MAEAIIRGVCLNYRILGDRGPAIALSPGGRRPLGDVQPLAERLAKAGHRVLLHDRRNCGASAVSFDATSSEYEVWADDLNALAETLGLLPLYAGGGSSGARLALLLAIRHPASVRGLLLWRITGGASAPELAEAYYGDFIRIAEQGGMAAVCATPHFADCIHARPGNRDRLMAMQVNAFVAVMKSWRDAFLREAAMPVIGASAAQLQAITAPTCVIAGNDPIHTRTAAQTLSHLLASATLHDDVISAQTQLEKAALEWGQKRDRVAQIFLDFLNHPAQVAHANRATAN